MPYPSYYNPTLAGYMNQPMQQQFPMPQFQQQNNYLGGKIVDSFDVVKVTDIPIDGNTYYFPKADSSEIYAKKWLGNGTTDIAVYKRVDNVVEEEPKFDFPTMETNIMEKLNAIDERITKIEKGLGNSKPIAKKEA